jgi:hypothetical protein
MASTSAGWNFEFWRQNHRPATQIVGWKFSLLFILIFFGLLQSAESGKNPYLLIPNECAMISHSNTWEIAAAFIYSSNEIRKTQN